MKQGKDLEEGAVKLTSQNQLRNSREFFSRDLACRLPIMMSASKATGIPRKKVGPEVDALPGPGGSFLMKFRVKGLV